MKLKNPQPMAALTRATRLSVEGAAAPANKAESKIAAPGALPPSEIDVPTMTAAETDDLLSAAAASMTFPAEPGTVTGRAASTTAGSGLTDGLRLSKKKIVPHLDISDNPSEVFVSKFSPDGALLAAGCGDGALRVFDAETGRLLLA